MYLSRIEMRINPSKNPAREEFIIKMTTRKINSSYLEKISMMMN